MLNLWLINIGLDLYVQDGVTLSTFWLLTDKSLGTGV